MKADNLRNYADASVAGIISRLIIRRNNTNKCPVIITVLPLLSMFTAVLAGIARNISGTDIAKLGLITLILTGAADFYIRVNAESVLKKKLSKTIITIGYLGAVCLLLLVPDPQLLCFWMLGGLIAAMLIDNKLGLLINFNMTFILGIMQNIRPETVIRLLIICVLMSVLAGALKDKSTVIYASIIILSINITLAFAINNFAFRKTNNFNYVCSLLSILAVLTAAYFLSALYQNTAGKGNLPDEQPLQKEPDFTVTKADNLSQQMITPAEEKTNEPAAVSSEPAQYGNDLSLQESAVTIEEAEEPLSKPVDRTSYELLCSLDHELLKRLRQFSVSLYSHAIRIADLSGRAAVKIGADELISRAGGLYHEIGKINGKNYIEEGLKLADEYAFPQELKAILKEHNIKYEKPNSVEAAIVMLSDNVVSTIEYLEKTGERRHTNDKIIDNIFQMRLDKGNFDSAGLSLTDFKKLKEFYITEFDDKKAERLE